MAEPEPKQTLQDIIAKVKADASPDALLSGPGRPTKFTPEAAAQIILAIRNGATLKDAAVLGGISYKTFWVWMTEGQDDDSQFRNFVMGVEAAEAELMTSMAQVVVKAALNDPKYALEILKRRRRFEWGDSFNVNDLTDQQVLELYLSFARTTGEDAA